MTAWQYVENGTLNIGHCSCGEMKRSHTKKRSSYIHTVFCPNAKASTVCIVSICRKQDCMLSQQNLSRTHFSSTYRHTPINEVTQKLPLTISIPSTFVKKLSDVR